MPMRIYLIMSINSTLSTILAFNAWESLHGTMLGRVVWAIIAAILSAQWLLMLAYLEKRYA